MKYRFLQVIRVSISVLVVLFFINSCQEPIPVGADLLDNDKIHLNTITDFDLTTTTIPGESVATYTSGAARKKIYHLGETNDNIYGKTSAEIYLRFKYNISSLPTYLTSDDVRFDSLVLVLKYDSMASYGNKTGMQALNVYQLEQAYQNTATYYSDTLLSYNNIPIYSNASLFINPIDSIYTFNSKDSTLTRQIPHLRIRLNDAFGKSIFENKELKGDTSLYNFIKGIYITSKSADSQPFLYGFDFSDAALTASNSINKLIMYYTQGDTLSKTYEYFIDNTIINRYVNNYDGSMVKAFIDTPAAGDSLSFIQGFGGVKTQIKFNDLEKLKDLSINKAELQVTVNELLIPNGNYALPPQLIATRLDKDGKHVFIEDIAIPLSVNSSFSNTFGGLLSESNNVYTYTLNITNHLKKIQKIADYPSDIYLSVVTESENPYKTSIYGAKHSKFPIKLNIIYTKN